MYITLGCSRSPVTVAVPKFNRSVAPGAVPGAFCPGPAFAALDAADGPEPEAAAPLEAFAGGVLAGLPVDAGAEGDAAPEVLARGSPASICAVDLGAGLAAGGGGLWAGAGVSCAAAAPQRLKASAPLSSHESR
jgi:hypothetical protein